MSDPKPITPDSPEAHINRELSWLSFARRGLALAEDPEQPLLERVKFPGVMGMIYDEFAMNRIGGLCRQVQGGDLKPGLDGLTRAQELAACRAELRTQQGLVARLVEEELRPALLDLGSTIPDVAELYPAQREYLTRYLAEAVESILTPLAADAAPSPSSATWASTWRSRSRTRAGTAAASCASKCRPTGHAGCPWNRSSRPT